jgi:hypothetical protein
MRYDSDDFEERQGPRDRSLRASDSDRDAFAEVLRKQHVAGRLDDEEFQLRLDRCLAAKTYADLDALVADLPREEQRQRRGRRPFAFPAPFAVLALVLIAIAVSHGHGFWLAIPLGFFFIVRPLLWRFTGRGGRGGRWGWHACGRGFAGDSL